MKAFGVVAAIFAALATLSPGSAVLCVAPGGHVAIEDINSGCCASHASHGDNSNQQGYELSSTDNCRNCRDIPITLDGYGLISKSVHFTATARIHAECAGIRFSVPPTRHSPPLREFNNIDNLVPACFSTLLRC